MLRTPGRLNLVVSSRLIKVYAGIVLIDSSLVRGLGLREATASNVVTMIGSAIFVTLPLVLSAMGGPQAMLAWLLGMLIALADGLVWAELGAALPGSGGTYVYLQEAFGPTRWGRLLSFVFLWGAALVMPLICAFIAVSLAQYGHYLWTSMTVSQGKLLAMGACGLATALLYRDIRAVGRISVSIFLIVASAALWIIVTGLMHFQGKMAFDFPPHAFSLSLSFLSGLGTATLITLLDYGGYATVCLCGGEIQQPSRTIPLSILYAILGVAVFYSLTSLAVIGVIPWREAAQSPFVISDFIARLHGPKAAQFLTLLVLFATFGSLFTTLLSFSRVLYAAAIDGQFFSWFARLHPTRRFPSGSVLALGVISSVLCVLPLETLLKAASGVAALTQCIPQTVAVLVIRRYRPSIALPFRMWLYPVPAWVALGGWWFVLLANEGWIIMTAFSLWVTGAAIYLWRAYQQRWWPFAGPSGVVKLT